MIKSQTTVGPNCSNTKSHFRRGPSSHSTSSLSSLHAVLVTHCVLQGRSSRIFIGPAKFLPFLSFPSHFPLPSEVGPVLRLGSLGERLSSPSGSGQSPAAKRILVHFELKTKASGGNNCIDFPENQLTKFHAKYLAIYKQYVFKAQRHLADCFVRGLTLRSSQILLWKLMYVPEHWSHSCRTGSYGPVLKIHYFI